VRKRSKYLLVFVMLFPVIAFAKLTPSCFQPGASMCFVENKDQVTDQYGNKRADIQYKLSAASGLSIFIGSGTLHYQFSQPQVAAATYGKHLKKLAKAEACPEYDMYRLDVTLEGANPDPVIIAGEQKTYKQHYSRSCIDGGGQTVCAFDKITYKNIYPGIDWVLYTKEGHLEYDFIVYPQGNINDIKVRYNGATELDNSDSCFTAFTPLGKIRECSLHSYILEDGRTVASGFEIIDSALSFHVAKHEGTLVIDPTLEWGTYYGGVNAEGIALAKGNSGTVYMAGYTTSPVDIATTGSYQTTYGGNNDAFLAKFDSNGVMLWATYYGGSSVDQAFGMAADSMGNVYIAGLTSSTSGIATAGVYQTNYGGGIGDAFLAKFSETGSLSWATYYGGSGTDLATGVCTDRSGYVYITGYTYSTDSIATPGAYKTSGGGSNVDAFIAKFNSSGTIKWATYYGGNDDDEPVSIVADDTGNVYMAGTTASTDSISTPGVYQKTFQAFADDDGFLVKFDSTGSLKWGTYYGANGSNELEQIICDGAGNIYMTGSSSCVDSIATTGAHQSSLIGAADAYLVKFSSAGAIQWGTYYGSGADGGNALAIDDTGNVFITGTTSSTTGIATPGAYQSANAGQGDAFLAKFSDVGSLLWATYYGGAAYDEGFGVLCAGNANVYVAGITRSASGIATPGAYNTVFSATAFNDDAFLAKFGPIPNTYSSIQTTPQPVNISISPNPANDMINVSWQEVSASPAELVIMDLSGRQFVEIAVASINNISIPVSMLPDGMYICRLQSPEGVYYCRFTKAAH